MVNHPTEADNQDNDELSVALDTLNAKDGTQPQVGDEVDVQVKGKVTRIDAQRNCAYVDPETLNGKPSPDEGEKSESDQGEELRQMAQQADQSPSSGGGY